MPLKDILLERMRNEFRTGVGEEFSVFLQDSLCCGRPSVESLLGRHGAMYCYRYSGRLEALEALNSDLMYSEDLFSPLML